MGKSCSCLHKLPSEHSYSNHLLTSSIHSNKEKKNRSSIKHKPIEMMRKTQSIHTRHQEQQQQQQQQQQQHHTQYTHIVAENNEISKPRLSKPNTSCTDSTKLLTISSRLQYTTGGVIGGNNNNMNNMNINDYIYNRINTVSASFRFNIDDDIYNNNNNNNNNDINDDKLQSFGDTELELHRIITIGYITQETDKYNNINIPLCIIEICRKYYFALKPIRRKRVIFTSIVQLNLCIDKIPKYILDESIFFFKVHSKNELISLFNTATTRKTDENEEDDDIDIDIDENEESLISETTAITANSLSFVKDLEPELIKYLKQKFGNNLLLLLDINTSWNDISSELIGINDIWYNDNNNDKRTYNELILDDIYWNNMENSKYAVSSMDILNEIHYGLLKYAPSMEILWQSNRTLIPMKIFDINQYHLENGHNFEFIKYNTKSRQTLHENPMKSSPHNDNDNNNDDAISVPTTYLNHSGDTFDFTTGSNADLVVLSMYNSGNDYSEQSYTANNNNNNKFEFLKSITLYFLYCCCYCYNLFFLVYIYYYLYCYYY